MTKTTHNRQRNGRAVAVRLIVFLLAVLLCVTAAPLSSDIHAADEYQIQRRNNDYALMDFWNPDYSHWESMVVRDYYVLGKTPEWVAYCVQQYYTGPDGHVYEPANLLLNSYPASLRDGIRIILQHGYPFDKLGLTNQQARHATQHAIWMIASEHGYEGSYPWSDLGAFSNTQLRNYAASGTIPGKVRAKSGQNSVLQAAVELLIKARSRNAPVSYDVSFSPPSISLNPTGGQLRATTTVTVQNARQGYKLTGIPSGVSVSGYTGKSGDKLTLSAPVSMVNSLSSFTLTAKAYDERKNIVNMYVLGSNDGWYMQEMAFLEHYVPRSLTEMIPANEAASRNMTASLPGDLAVTSLTTGKSTYDAGEAISGAAIVRNDSIRTMPSHTLQLTRTGMPALTYAVRSLSRGQGAAVNFYFDAPEYVDNTTMTLTATADPDNTFVDADRSNNSITKTIEIRGMPDLVPRIQMDKSSYEGGDTATVLLSVENIGKSTARGFYPYWRAYEQGRESDPIVSWRPTEYIVSVEPGATSTPVSREFTIPIRPDAGTVVVEFDADYLGRVNEANEDNNRATVTRPFQPTLDLGFGDHNISGYFTDKDVVISMQVRNLTSSPVPEADILCEFNGATQVETIAVPPNATNIVSFRLSTPAYPGVYDLNLEIDPQQKLLEVNRSNNYYLTRVAVDTAVRYDMPDPEDDRLEQDHFARDKKIPDVPEWDSGDLLEWDEFRYEAGSFVRRSFWAQLNTSFEVRPDPRASIAADPNRIESGFGVTAHVTTTITTNYDRPDKLVGPQMVRNYYPETGYDGDPEWDLHNTSLIPATGAPGAISEIVWEYDANIHSIYDSRVHFTPVWWPDGPYTVMAQAFYAWSPAGQLFSVRQDHVDIDGAMYDRFPVQIR